MTVNSQRLSEAKLLLTSKIVAMSPIFRLRKCMLRNRRLPDYHGLGLLGRALGRESERSMVNIRPTSPSTVIYSYNAKV